MLTSPFSSQFSYIHTNQASLTGANRALWSRHRAGELHRIHRGRYLDSQHWAALDPTEQHVALIEAIASRNLNDFRVVGLSAGALWGMWLPWPPARVQIISYGQGAHSYPGYQRRRSPISDPTFTHIRNISVLNKVETAVWVATQLPNGWALCAMDWLRRELSLSQGPIAEDVEATLRSVIARLSSQTKRDKALQTLELSTSLSMSAGESWSRFIIWAAGFEAPVLQKLFYDEKGLVGRADFYFPLSNHIGEFDGMAKYSQPEYLAGRISAQVVIDEKLREDRLRRQVRGLSRWVSSGRIRASRSRRWGCDELGVARL